MTKQRVSSLRTAPQLKLCTTNKQKIYETKKLERRKIKKRNNKKYSIDRVFNNSI